jgi:hypothetical protein
MSPLATRFEDFDADEAYSGQAAMRGKDWDISSKAKMVRAARHRRNQGKAKLYNGAHLRRNSRHATC